MKWSTTIFHPVTDSFQIESNSVPLRFSHRTFCNSVRWSMRKVALACSPTHMSARWGCAVSVAACIPYLLLMGLAACDIRDVCGEPGKLAIGVVRGAFMIHATLRLLGKDSRSPLRVQQLGNLLCLYVHRWAKQVYIRSRALLGIVAN